jgi:hypothetical protein
MRARSYSYIRALWCPVYWIKGLQTPYDEGQTAVHYLRYRRTAGLVDSQIVGTAPRTTR